ncbi:hypothetical protein [Nostoc sp. WHI]|uniref:hypothetical protein n=1 Tax=Nostoc sp. WHI TaxID=2650611 RepID=UPI0018C50BD6|nr:hypothetical protein [Nostoc sp. WHI]MBG1271997.1 hypothetical protein [Nostoc sp. WHI]
MMKNAIYEGDYSLIITNYPPFSEVEPGKPVHEAHILPGKQEGAYFAGEYAKCVEASDAFFEDYERYCNEFKNEDY